MIPDDTAAWRNVLHRRPHNAAFAHLCKAAPIPASSDRTHRHRLSRGGDNVANNAFHIVVLGRLRYHAHTRAYTDRRAQQSHPHLKSSAASNGTSHERTTPHNNPPTQQNHPMRPLDDPYDHRSLTTTPTTDGTAHGLGL
ncbi:transposase [Arthrobacter sp. CAN_A6]|uniref:transposase n=1 Tax=Arthrobacter sp. CAN_A6 TaxID=2787721 RepID=UPI003FA42286